MEPPGLKLSGHTVTVRVPGIDISHWKSEAKQVMLLIGLARRQSL